MSRRVVITGLGVAAPNGVGLKDFEASLRKGKSGITFHPELKELDFQCQIAGKPEVTNDILQTYFTPLELRGLQSTGIIYGVIAGMEAWKDAGLKDDNELTDWDSGIIFGTGTLGVEKFREAVQLIDEGKTRRLGSTAVMQTMSSGISAFLNAKIGCGNIVTSNSSACATGTEAVLMAYDHIKSGKATRILAGSCSDSGPYVWGGFEALRILPHQYNDTPKKASRPMSATAAGIVPGSGAGALVLEELEQATKRGAKIYAEVLGGHINSGGQRNGGTMTAPNAEGVIKCIEKAVKEAGIHPSEIDSINGHLTATQMDALEIENWKKALQLKGEHFPVINSLKSLTGHCLSASGSIECVASVLQIDRNFIFGNINCEDLHQDIQKAIPKEKIITQTTERKVDTVIKASFGFGDVNAAVVFRKYD